MSFIGISRGTVRHGGLLLVRLRRCTSRRDSTTGAPRQAGRTQTLCSRTRIPELIYWMTRGE